MMTMQEFCDGVVEDCWPIISDVSRPFDQRIRAFLMMTAAISTFSPSVEDDEVGFLAIKNRLDGLPNVIEGAAMMHLLADAMATGVALRDQAGKQTPWGAR